MRLLNDPESTASPNEKQIIVVLAHGKKDCRIFNTRGGFYLFQRLHKEVERKHLNSRANVSLHLRMGGGGRFCPHGARGGLRLTDKCFQHHRRIRTYLLIEATSPVGRACQRRVTIATFNVFRLKDAHWRVCVWGWGCSANRRVAWWTAINRRERQSGGFALRSLHMQSESGKRFVTGFNVQPSSFVS